MSDPATDPDHDLVDHPQDRPQPRIRLGTVLGLLRILAGHRGHAIAAWHRDGFSYTLIAERTHDTDHAALDVDPDAIGGDDAQERLLEALGD